MTTTLNGAISHSTTGDARLDLFFKIVRDTEKEDLHRLLEESMKLSPLDTLKLIFHLRDCRGGKGEKKQFNLAIHWLATTHPQLLKLNLEAIPEYGYYKDLLTLLDTALASDVLKLYAAQLKSDLAKLDTADKFNISLAAKWAPTEGLHHDRKYHAVSKLCKRLGVTKKEYRSKYIVPLRKHLNIVETLMCQGHWDEIDFSKLPSVALKRYVKAFKTRVPERYNEFLEKVKAGTAKMNVARLEPHEIIGPYTSYGAKHDETIEVTWSKYLEGLRAKGAFKNALAVVDVSGSMQGTPIKVAIALGMILADLTVGPFHDKWITFSATPMLESIKGSTVYEKVKNMVNNPNWMMNTDLQAVFNLLLTSASMYNLSPEQMPETIFIFSDMQFDVACHSNDKTNYEEIEAKYRAAGYKRPKLVFWNLSGSNIDFPVTDKVPDTALVSGFNPDLLNLFLEDGEVTPYGVMRRAIDNARYDKIKV